MNEEKEDVILNLIDILVTIRVAIIVTEDVIEKIVEEIVVVQMTEIAIVTGIQIDRDQHELGSKTRGIQIL